MVVVVVVVVAVDEKGLVTKGLGVTKGMVVHRCGRRW